MDPTTDYNYDDILNRLAGKVYDGACTDNQAQGKGTYVLDRHIHYEGNFHQGMFDGQGTLVFEQGGKFVASWEKGTLIQGTYYYDDGCQFQPHKWTYCTDADRRFWSEICHGVRVEDSPQLTDREPAPHIPPGCYDLGNGYYNPRAEKAFSYNGEFSRKLSQLEIEWCIRKCRIGTKQRDSQEQDEPLGIETKLGVVDAKVSASNEVSSKSSLPFEMDSKTEGVSTEALNSLAMRADPPTNMAQLCPATLGEPHAVESGFCMKCGEVV